MRCYFHQGELTDVTLVGALQILPVRRMLSDDTKNLGTLFPCLWQNNASSETYLDTVV
jgi:hypothetical protein